MVDACGALSALKSEVDHCDHHHDAPAPMQARNANAHTDGDHAAGHHVHAHKCGHHHADGHHDHRRTSARKLTIALALSAVFMVVEAVVGWLSGSLALLADAGHMLSDTAALGLALFAQHIAAQPRSEQRTFGFRRAEVLAAFVNGIALAVSSVWIIHEAIGRLMHPNPIAGHWMLGTAVLGLIVNLVAAYVLQAGGHDNTNTRAAYLHVIADAAGSVGAIGAGVLVLAFGWYRADPAISFFIACLIVWGAWRLVRETTAVLMEGTPSHVDVGDLEATIRAVQGVCTVHDLHAWTISDGFHAVTAHVVLNGSRHGTDVVTDAAKLIKERHGIDHVTLQPEAPVPGLVQLRLPHREKKHGESR